MSEHVLHAPLPKHDGPYQSGTTLAVGGESPSAKKDTQHPAFNARPVPIVLWLRNYC
jgi:hypothetical protein